MKFAHPYCIPALVVAAWLAIGRPVASAQTSPPAKALPALAESISKAPWTWELGGKNAGILTLNADGSAAFRLRNNPSQWAWSWEAEGDSAIVLTNDHHQKTTLKFNAPRTEFHGADYKGLVLVGHPTRR